jgi:predicted PurR-regulated permease PerM
MADREEVRYAAPLWVLALLAAAMFLRAASDLCVPIAIAGLLSFALAPIVRLLQRGRLPRLAATAVLLAVIAGVSFWGVAAAGDSIADTIRDLPRTVRQVRARMHESGGTLLERLNRAAAELREGGDGQHQQTPTTGQNVQSAVTSAVWSGSASAFTLLGNLVVVLFLVFFFLATGGTYRPRLVRLAAPHLSSAREASAIIDEITSQIERFVLVRIGTAILVGLATWIALRIVGAPQPALWGTLAGAFNSIPFFGPVIVSGGLLIVGLLAQGVGFGFELAAIALVITTIEGWLVTPPLLGRVARMHTLAVLLGLLFWSWIWGLWGTILAVPMLAILKVLSEHLAPLAPVARLLEE